MLYDILVFVESMFSASIPGGVAESVDAADLKSVSRKRVRVQVSPSPCFTASYVERVCERKHNFAVWCALCFRKT